MSRTRFRQIAHLEKLAKPYLDVVRQTEREWAFTFIGAAKNAAYLAFLIRYGKPKIGEPLSCAWERVTNTKVWKEYSDKWEARALEQFDVGLEKHGEWKNQDYLHSPFDRDGVSIGGGSLRHELIARFPGTTEKEKLKGVFASAPPWLIWFTFADYTAQLLSLPLPDLSSVKGFVRSKADFNNWYGLPTGAFVARPWPNGPDNETLARTDLNLLHPATAWPDRQMTPREQKRARAAYMKSLPTKHIEYWPLLQDVESLAMPFHKVLKLLRDRGSDAAIDDDADRDWT